MIAVVGSLLSRCQDETFVECSMCRQDIESTAFDMRISRRNTQNKCFAQDVVKKNRSRLRFFNLVRPRHTHTHTYTKCRNLEISTFSLTKFIVVSTRQYFGTLFVLEGPDGYRQSLFLSLKNFYVPPKCIILFNHIS